MDRAQAGRSVSAVLPLDDAVEASVVVGTVRRSLRPGGESIEDSPRLVPGGGDVAHHAPADALSHEVLGDERPAESFGVGRVAGLHDEREELAVRYDEPVHVERIHANFASGTSPFFGESVSQMIAARTVSWA